MKEGNRENQNLQKLPNKYQPEFILQERKNGEQNQSISGPNQRQKQSHYDPDIQGTLSERTRQILMQYSPEKLYDFETALMASTEPEDFIVDKDTSDQIITEVSDLSPHEDCEIKARIKTISDIMIEKYGKFIPDKTVSRAKSLPERVLVVDKEYFDNFRREWRPERIPLTDLHIKLFDVIGGFIKEGNVILIDNSAGHLNTQLIHESIHQFQDRNLTSQYVKTGNAFIEIGTPFYSRMVTERLGIPFYSRELDIPRDIFYSSLINLYGDNVHKLAFGSGLEQDRKETILGNITQEVQNTLFPTRKY